jgi:hypothetical protein
MRNDNDELREACARFLAICDSSWTEVFSTGTFDEAAHRELRFRWIEVRLIAPEEVAWSATDLYFTVSGRTTAWTDAIPSAEYADRVESFLTAVRAELGKPPTRLSRPEDTLPDVVEGED